MAPQSTTIYGSSSTAKFHCKLCIRRFDTLDELGRHHKAHAAAAKKKQNPSKARGRKVQIGLCMSCIVNTPFGVRVTSVVHIAYFLRVQQHAALERRRASSSGKLVRTSVAPVGNCDRCPLADAIAVDVGGGEIDLGI